mgnify:CR=1 FL=1
MTDLKDQGAYLAQASEPKVDNVALIKPSSTDHSLYPEIVNACKQVFDPEIPVNIYDLGLIYDIKIEGRKAEIKMTLTTPNCPVAESLPKEVKDSAMQVEEIDDVNLELVWDPPWNKDMMSDAAKLELNL